MNWLVLRALFLIFGGCCANVLTLESITKHDPGAGVLVTLAQFAFVTLYGLFRNMEPGALRLQKRKVPVSYYILYCAVFFALSTLNNAALGYEIAMPLHMIFRSGSLVMSLLLGFLLLGRRYPLRRIFGVAAVTAGIYIATTASINGMASVIGPGGLRVLFTGIAMLLTALVLSSGLGIFQEYIFKKFGRCEAELQFYSHGISLLFFLPFLAGAVDRARSWSGIALWQLPLGLGHISSLYFYLLANCITQQICITGVYEMTSAAGSLAMTLAITLRKFVSLLFSVWLFGNSFSERLWFATALVFIGSISYSWPESGAQKAAAGTPTSPAPAELPRKTAQTETKKTK